MTAPLHEARREQMFPTLTPAQIERLAAYGKKVPIRAGEVLAEPGERCGGILVVLSGAIEILRPGIGGKERMTVLLPGHFPGVTSFDEQLAAGLNRVGAADAALAEAAAPVTLNAMLEAIGFAALGVGGMAERVTV